MKVIFEKISGINFLPIINFTMIGKIYYITFGIYNYLLHLKFGSYNYD